VPDLRLLRETTLRDMARVQVAEAGMRLVAPKPLWLAEALTIPDSLTWGLFKGDGAVGVISVLDPRLQDPDEDDRRAIVSACGGWRSIAGHGAAAMRCRPSRRAMRGGWGCAVLR
jgi:hypothetical protein